VLSAKLQGDPGGYNNHNYPEVTGIYSNIFADGVFGATVGFDLNKRASLNETTSSSPGACSNYRLDPTDLTNTNRLCTGGARHSITQYRDKGSAANVLATKTGYLSLQWKPIDSTVATLRSPTLRGPQDVPPPGPTSDGVALSSKGPQAAARANARIRE